MTKNIHRAAGLMISTAVSTAVAGTFVIEQDILVTVEAGAIVTGAIEEPEGPSEVHFFGYRFQEDPKDPYFLQDPGFIAPAGSGLPPSSSLRFDAVRHLAFWNGNGPVSFTRPATSEALRFSFGAASVTITGTSGAQSGFTIGNVSSNGSLHRHLNSTLLAGSAPIPAEGIYFTNIRLFSSDNAIFPSDSLYIVFNNGVDEKAFADALQYLASPIAGDANFDGVVNLLDFNILASNFGSGDRFWYEGDFNGDRVVNLADFNALAANFGGTNGVQIPEPAALGWAAASFLMLRRRRMTGSIS